MSGETGWNLTRDCYSMFLGSGVNVAVAIPPGDDGSAAGRRFVEKSHIEAVAPLTDGRVAVLLTVNVAVPEPGDIQRLLILGADGNVLSDTPLQADDGVAQDLFPGPAGSLVTVDTTRQGRPEYSRYDPRDLLIRRRDEAGRILASFVVADRCAYQGQFATVPTAGSLTIGAFACDRTVLFPDDEARRVRCFSAGERDLMLLGAEWP